MLWLHVKVDINGIHDFLRLCLARYHSDEYKENFGWIDQIKPVKDSLVIAHLDSLVIEHLRKNEFDKLWMAPPEIVDWLDIGGFRYKQPKRSEIRKDLDLREFMACLEGAQLTSELLRETPIHLISSASGDATDNWSAYKCLCGEVDYNGNVFVLNNAKWYEVIRDFAAEVNQSFASMPECDLALPNYTHSSEGEYNEFAVGQIPSSFLMDKKTITHGGGYSSIEFCDIATDAKKLIHVKRYGGSSQLSHLFSQGVVSGELFVQDEGFRRKLNKKLPRGRRLADPRTRPVASEYEIVFGIVSKSLNPLNLPFFSKVTMRNARQRLEGYGYKVSKKKIQQV